MREYDADTLCTLYMYNINYVIYLFTEKRSEFRQQFNYYKIKLIRLMFQFPLF